MIELCGHFPRSLIEKGKFAQDYFTKNGSLKHIQHLNFWTLKDVLSEKYRFVEKEAEEIADFIDMLLQVIFTLSTVVVVPLVLFCYTVRTMCFVINIH